MLRDLDLRTLFEFYSKYGKDALRNLLSQYDIDVLKDIIRLNGMDRTYKSLRWKNKNRVLDFIVEYVERSMKSGSSFMY